MSTDSQLFIFCINFTLINFFLAQLNPHVACQYLNKRVRKRIISSRKLFLPFCLFVFPLDRRAKYFSNMTRFASFDYIFFIMVRIFFSLFSWKKITFDITLEHSCYSSKIKNNIKIKNVIHIAVFCNKKKHKINMNSQF
jgi:hypothetical protein